MCTRSRLCEWTAVLTVLLVSAAHRLPAQETFAAPPVSPWGEAVAPPDAPLTFSAPPSRPESARLPQAPLPTSPVRVAGGTLVGGALGAAALAGTGALLGSGDDSGFISASAVFAVVGAGVGYPIGAALGARWAATAGGRKPPLGTILLASVGGVAVGALIWNRVGEAFQSEDPLASDYSSWYAGAAAGAATHLAITSFVAYREGTKVQRLAEER